MKKAVYHQINPLIRGRELDLLSAEFFDRLIQTETIAEAGDLLQTTVYQQTVDASFPENFEEKLDQESEHLFQELAELAPEPEIVWLYTMRYTFHNLKVLSKGEFLQQDLDQLCVYDGFYTIETLKRAIRTGVSQQLPESVLASIREVTDYLQESAIAQGIDVIYDRCFLKAQRQLGEKLAYPELTAEITAFIDLTNLVTLGRGLLQKRSKGFLTGVLSSYGSIPKESLLEFAASGYEAYIAYLKMGPYHEVLQPAFTTDGLDLGQLERLKDDHLTAQFQLAQTQAFGPLPLLAFLNAKEIETKNLRTVIVGKRSGFTNEQIKERMRQINEL